MYSSTELTMYIFVPSEYETLRAFYRYRIQDHNNTLYNSAYADSGFDLGLPKNFQITKTCSNKIHLGVHCSMYVSIDTKKTPQAYYLYPRSSIVKTPLRLSNSVGIIDRGYRGEITAFVDIIDHQRDTFDVYAMDRHFQICHPSLEPFKVVMVDTKEELGLTERGDDGFGSTGR